MPSSDDFRAHLAEAARGLIGGRVRTHICKSSRLIATVILVALAGAGAARAEWRHGLSVFGDLKYGPDFKHFEYVNPDAPKGGRMALIGGGNLTTFDSFNNFIIKGDRAQGLELLYDSLMARAADEPDAVYGLIAESAEVAADGRSVTFRMRPEAKFADGSPVTADDVVFSFEMLRDVTVADPAFHTALTDVVKAEALDAATVRYTFKGDLVRDLPVTVAELPVLPKAFYATRQFGESSLEPPLGSGPYKIASFKPGSSVTYARRNNYWAAGLAVNRGRYNFDELRYEYFRDRVVELENLFAGNFDFREEFTSVHWATRYKVPPVADGRIVVDTLPDGSPSGAQGFFMNTRRDKFKDRRVRQALDLAFDFEWSNKTLFYGLYTRTGSYFENSDMKATGPPSAGELALLEPFRDTLPPEVFTGEPYSPPVTDGSGSDRKLLSKAGKLLTEAGWTVKDGRRVNAAGERFTIELLFEGEGFERIIAPFAKNLGNIGIDATLRMVGPAEYRRRLDTFEFDMAIQRYVMRLTPGVELRNYWNSASAKFDASRNLPGITDPAVDALIERVMAAKSRAELVTAARAIDRVLRAGHYWVPQYFKAAHNVAYWNKYSRPAVKPTYDRGLDTWWYDAGKAAKLAAN